MAKNSGAGDFDPSTILNQGVIAHTVPQRRRKRASPEKTLLVTGLARSGTSMLAAMLQSAGIWLGDHVYEPINEDAEITQMLRARDLFRLDALIKRQNAKTPIWGFKMPDLHQFLQHDELTRFRNPHLIVIFRDPVALAVRNVVSEHVDGAQAMVEATSAMHSLTRFVLASHLPFLFLSYEKALLFPRVFVDSVLSFCGVTVDEAKQGALLHHIQPNRAQYVLTANRSFEGYLEGVVEGRLCGWARHVGQLSPLMLDLLIDDRPAASFPAAEFRGDLLAANVGNGSHAFSLDLADFQVTDRSVIWVRISRRSFELVNSGKSLAELKVLREAR